MRLYHGSEKIISKPSFDFKNSKNDYGSGFYCTEDFNLAGEWACKKNSNGFINEYRLDDANLRILNLNSPEYNILHWLALLTRYRGYWQAHSIAEDAKSFLQENFLPDISSADLIIGYRADDSYFSFAQDFISGTISLQQLSKAMRLGKFGQQIVLKSPLAFEKIIFISDEIALAEEYYQKKVSRDLSARHDYALEKNNRNIDDIYIIDILRGKVKLDGLRI